MALKPFFVTFPDRQRQGETERESEGGREREGEGGGRETQTCVPATRTDRWSRTVVLASDLFLPLQGRMAAIEAAEQGRHRRSAPFTPQAHPALHAAVVHLGLLPSDHTRIFL